MKFSHSSLALAAAFLLASSAQAVVVTGTTAGAPTWTRPLAGTPPTTLSAVGIGVNYTVVPFTVSTAGSYVFLSTATSPLNWDNYTFLYQTSFSPTAQFTNVLTGNDDNPSIGSSGFTYALTTGTSYYFITTGFAPGDAGAYSLSITGPGSVNLVPEPTSYALLGLGLVGTLLAARRQRAV